MQDSDDELVSATFSALQYLVPLLGAHVIIGGERLRQFTERRPKVTVNLVKKHGKLFLTRLRYLNCMVDLGEY